MTRKVAVILLNLGGPDRLESVQPFLYNLFRDPAIIGLPQPLRWLVAKLISTRRAPVAQEIYRLIGGKSPLLELTRAQADALDTELNAANDAEYRCFIAMRYWHPLSAEAARQAKEWGATELVLLPLYPQFSTTTTGSSFTDWDRAARGVGLRLPTRRVGCYPFAEGLVAAHADYLRAAYSRASAHGKPRILFSAHGLPQKVVDAGDPYQWQVERTVQAVLDVFAHSTLEGEGVALPDHVVCYQSKVGPLKWLEPSTEAAIRQACADRVPIVLVPIAFVSEHSETLVELDIEYRHLADGLGCVAYERVPALGTHPEFIGTLARAVRAIEATDGGTTSSEKMARLCPPGFGKCVCRDTVGLAA